MARRRRAWIPQGAIGREREQPPRAAFAGRGIEIEPLSASLGPAVPRPFAWAAGLAILAAIAWWTSGLGATDMRYALAGLTNPAMNPTLVGTAVALVALWLIAIAAVWLIRRAGRALGAHPLAGHAYRGVLFAVVAAIVGYAGGAGATLAAGGPVEYPGTLTFAYGSPIAEAVTVDATCRTIVGDPSTLASVNGGVVQVDLRHVVRAVQWHRLSSTGNDRPVLPASFRSRPFVVRQWLDANGQVVSEEELPFFGVYDVSVARASEAALSGSMEVRARRQQLGAAPWYRLVNAQIEGDPWPSEFGLTLHWSCRGTGDTAATAS